MKSIKSNNRSKGSVLVAVIGILAVLSIMALRFNAEMETAMIKTAGRNISSDVKVIADSGLKYVISQLLKNGNSCDGSAAGANGRDHPALAIEEAMEMDNLNAATAINNYGAGIGYEPEYYSSSYFYAGKKSTLSTSYIPDALSLSPGNINFMIEDLSGKLPIGHISQWYQRLLVSATLCKLMTNTVPLNFNSELFENTNSSEIGGYDDYGGKSIYLRSLVPYEQAVSSSADHRDVAGLPLGDGILALEELGSTYTWIKGTNKDSEKKHATDYPRSASDYLILSGALTPFSRFSFYDADVSYASLNPMVMCKQNEKLYKALFNFEPDDNQLKMYFSVGFPPADITVKVDNKGALKGAIADNMFFQGVIGPNLLLSAMPSATIATTPTTAALPFSYNARDDASDKRPEHRLADANFLAPSSAALKYDDKKSWNDGEFLAAPTAAKAYYTAMDKACERLSRAFKGSKLHRLPAENVMNPIMTRKTLELAIIKAVFGDSILFVISDIAPNPTKKVFLNDYDANKGIVATANLPGEVNYLRMLRAIENNEIDLTSVQFVENAFSTAIDDDMAKAYFVPAWGAGDEYAKDVTPGPIGKFAVTNTDNTQILVPAMGLSNVGGKYVNYLPHPYTDQRALNNTFVSVAAAYSDRHKGSIATAGPSSYNVFGLYTAASVPVTGCKMAATDATEAFADLSPLPGGASVVANSGTPADMVKLYKTDPANVNFKPADFSPYETKIRMAVLVNLLNAIIPVKVTETKNTSNEDVSFWGAAPVSKPKNLKEFIGCTNGVYSIEDTVDYMLGFSGGVQTPGMTFWKYGVHSTTFQVTVDAFKYEDSARLSSVVTFDLLDNTGAQLVARTHYNVDNSKTPLDANFKSAIYLNPTGRRDVASEKFAIGNGNARFPNVTDTKGWRILSFVWSSSFGRGVTIPDYFSPIIVYPETAANIGGTGTKWEYKPHSSEPIFTKFFYGPNSQYRLWERHNQFAIVDLAGTVMDYSTGSAVSRKRSYGANSWLKWQVNCSKSMPANSLELVYERQAGGSAYVLNHLIEISKKSTNEMVLTIPFSTTTNSSTTSIPFTIPVAMDAGEYYLKLTAVNESAPAGNDEKFIRIRITEK